MDKLGSFGNKLGALSCRTPEPFPWPPTGLGLGLQAAVNLSPALLCDLRAVAICLGHSLRYPDPPAAPPLPPFGQSEESEGQLGWLPGSFSDDTWAVWRHGPEEAAD